ncbi:hypothetical protein ACQKWADRAFT_323294 [Trichoderma austrokoningii]
MDKSKSKGRAKSCTCCRQAKVACDARKTRTGQCSRCRLKQLDCRFDANFKRISTRRITEEIRQELHALRSSEDAAYAQPSTAKTITSSQSISDDNATAPMKSAPGPASASLWLDITDSDAACSFALGTLNLDAQTAIELFRYPASFDRRQNMWPGFGLVPECEVDEVYQACTWLGCFRVGILSSRVAINLGFTSPISQQHMKSIDEALDSTSNLIPPWWKVLITILKITVSAIDTLNNIDNHALQFSSTEIFIEQLHKLKETEYESWRPELEIEWCNTKLHIFALTFTTPANTDANQDTHWRIHRQTILLKAFDAASSLVTHFMKLGQDHVSELHPNGLLRTIPEPYFTSLFNAAAFFFRFMATFMALTPTQGKRAMDLIIEAHKIFHSFPERRELTRAAIHIEALIDALKQGVPVGMGELTMKNKLGASVIFDAIFHACRQRNIDSQTGKPLAMQQWKTVTETFAERLPETITRKKGYEAQQLESGVSDDPEQIMSLTELNAQWWEEWDNYINLNQIGDEQLDMI